MICFPNAKINLGLHIIEKRPDGFHNIETVFCPIGWCDVLEVVENRSQRRGTDKISLGVSGIKAGSAKSNLVTKAYRLLDEQFDLPPVRAHLHKTIPVGAGLGGGSSDAAFLVKLLNEKFSLGISHKDQVAMAAKLGSDCAFFIENKPVLAQGKGNQFTPLDIDLQKYHVVVVFPAIHSNTAEAYKGVIPVKPAHDLKTTVTSDIKKWSEQLANDFEKNIFYRFPEIENVKTKLYENGALYASMSGSGSAVFGLFAKEIDAKEFGFPSNYLIWSSAVS